jgi:hypothetical protein
MIAVTTTLHLLFLQLFKNGQLYGKTFGTGFVGMYGPSQCLGRAGQWICWPQKGTKNLKKEIVKTKVKILTDMSQ